jgi:uncharacterized protein
MRQTGRKVLIFVALLFSVSLSMAEVAVPALKSRVTDLTGTLAASETAKLEQKLAAFEARKGSQIAVLIIPTTEPETIEQYSIRVAEAWKLGRKGIDDGALLLIAKQDRTVRIEVGYGLEGVLPDALAKRIVDEVIVPAFRQGNFVGGINGGIEQMMRVIEGEPLPPPQARHGEGAPAGSAVMDNIIPLFIMLIVVAKVLQSFFGRFIGAGIISASAGFLGWLLFSSIVIGVIAAILAFCVRLFGSPGGGIYRGGRGGWPGGGMGGRGGFGGGGGGFGGGGGGGFGGGGASGRW